MAKPIPKIKIVWSASVIHPGSRNRAQGAGGARLWKGVEHALSPLNAPSLLDADTHQQSENAIARRSKRLSLANHAGEGQLCSHGES
ncbi:hypothetical protein [Pseudomonas siliginis]|uniref:hypothetical protein n=1 Tax=Pseudomonas siliginis TaxID=2842346 RepID=UPI001C3D81E6|nr:hypothetical protein [Pseudomonas siliginis]MBV4469299.1 hypothetical protein [Pseudomonas siliginis]